MKAVMISIQPISVEKIVKGEKTIKVSKLKPSLETPFKCYIYMTQGKVKDLWNIKEWTYRNRMKVIGEFICDKIYDITPHNDGYSTNQYICGWKYGKDNSCLDFEQLNNYLKGKDGYGWHISDLKIYDKPKELSEFRKPCSSEQCASYCRDMKLKCDGTLTCLNRNKRFIKHPPQSWYYIEGE